MQRLRATALTLYNHNFIRFLFVGGSTFILDFGILLLLHVKAGHSIAVSTSIAYWISVIYNFALNRYWTFDAREKESLRRHVATYAVLLIFNYVFVVTFVSVASHHFSYLLAKALAVLIQMTWTYQIYKKVIFVTPALDSSESTQ